MERDHLTGKRIYTIAYGHTNGGKIKVSLGLRDNFGDSSFRTPLTPEIRVKSEKFLLTDDQDILVKLDFLELSVEDIDTKTHVKIGEAIAKLLW